jgi:cyclase
VTIDYANGGSPGGIINPNNNYLAITNSQTKYVPGHGPLSTRADIVRYRDMLISVRYFVRAEIQAGKTDDQAVADKPIAPIGKTLGTNQQADDAMVRMSAHRNPILGNVKAQDWRLRVPICWPSA